MQAFLKIKRLTSSATLPTRASSGSAGYDLYADILTKTTINPNETMKISIGISIEIDEKTVALIYARSGLATKFGIAPANCVGVIDSDYRGEIIVPLHNYSDSAYTISPNERIAQLVLTPIFTPEIIEEKNLSETERGENGFGSTGKK